MRKTFQLFCAIAWIAVAPAASASGLEAAEGEYRDSCRDFFVARRDDFNEARDDLFSLLGSPLAVACRSSDANACDRLGRLARRVYDTAMSQAALQDGFFGREQRRIIERLSAEARSRGEEERVSRRIAEARGRAHAILPAYESRRNAELASVQGVEMTPERRIRLYVALVGVELEASEELLEKACYSP